MAITSKPLDLDLRLSQGSRSNPWSLDLDLSLSYGSRPNPWPLDLDLSLSCGSRSNLWPLDLDLSLGSRSNPRSLDLDLRLGCGSRSNQWPLDLDLRLGRSSRSNLQPLNLDLRLSHRSRSNPCFRCYAHFWPKWRVESLVRGLKILCLKIANALPWSCTKFVCWTQAAKMHKLLRYSGVQCKNTEADIFVYGGKRVKCVVPPKNGTIM